MTATIELLEVQNQLQGHEIERLSPKSRATASFSDGGANSGGGDGYMIHAAMPAPVNTGRGLDSFSDAGFDDMDDEIFFSYSARQSVCQKPAVAPSCGLVATSTCRRELREILVTAVFAVSLAVYFAVILVLIPASLFGVCVRAGVMADTHAHIELEPEPEQEPEPELGGMTLFFQPLAASLQQIVDGLMIVD